MTPPAMAGWNLALRFALEIGALTSLAVAAWKFAPDAWRWPAVVAAPLTAAAVWGVFNVLNDPSRSGAAPVQVAGRTRLAIELLILGGGAVAIAYAGRSEFGVIFGLLIAAHYVSSWSRLEWLIQA